MNICHFFRQFNNWNKFILFTTATILFLPQDASAIDLQLGNPTAPKGGKTTEVTYKILCNSGGTTNIISTNVKIKVNSNDTANGKALKLNDAINDNKTLTDTCKDENTITFSDDSHTIALDPDIKAIFKLSGDDSEQKDTFISSKESEEGEEGEENQSFEITIDGKDIKLSGVDLNGNSSEFFASFGFNDGFNDYVATSNILFTDLPNNTIDDLLTLTYDNLFMSLPTPFQSDLMLDLDTDEISYTFTPDIVTAFVETKSTDTGGGYGQGMEVAVPEPLTILGSATALGFGALFKRKLKGSKTTQKVA